MAVDVIYTDAEELTVFIENGHFIAWAMTSSHDDTMSNIEEWLSEGSNRYTVLIKNDGTVIYNGKKYEKVLLP